MEYDGVTIDRLKWFKEGGSWMPLCSKHHLRMELKRNDTEYCTVRCEECQRDYLLPREWNKQRRYIQNKLDSKSFAKMKYLNIDGEYVPIAENKVKDDDGEYFVKSILTEAKTGKTLVVYAGKQAKGDNKTQIFIDPNTKKLSFDPSNEHPAEIFVKLEAQFKGGQKQSIESE